MKLLIALIAAAAWAQPPSIKADGVPPIPAELLEDLAQYENGRTASFADWHPLKREMLISTRFGELPQAHHVAMPGGARTQLTFSTERIGVGNYNPATGDSFVYSRDVGGAEFYQLYLFDVKTGRSTLLTDGKSRNGNGLWSPKGNLIAHTSTRRNGRDSDIYVLNPRDPKSVRMVMQAPSPGWGIHDWSPDEKKLLVGRYKSAVESAVYELEIASGKLTALTPESGASYWGAEYAADENGAYVNTNQGSDFLYIAHIDKASRKLTRVTPEMKWNVSGFVLSRDRKRMAYTINEDGAAVLHVIDTQSGREMKLPRLPYGLIGGLTWHANGRELGFSFTSAKSPSDAYSLDVDSGKLERWTFSETGGLNTEEFVEPELIRWKSFDGLTISGYLYKPPARFAGARPVLISIHGGPEGQYRPGFLGRNNYLLNELGIAIIYPNVRGSTGYGTAFLNADNARKREDSVKDIGTLLDWIGTRKDLNAGRVMVSGGSYGGYMTLASMTHFNDRLRGGIDTVGIANWITFLQNTEDYRRDLRRAEYGDERDPGMRDFLSSISPVHHAKRMSKPMMVVQGRNDPRVPYTESEQIVKAVRSNGVPVWYVLAADEGHGFRKKRNIDYEFAVRVMFLKEHLLK